MIKGTLAEQEYSICPWIKGEDRLSDVILLTDIADREDRLFQSEDSISR